jgi:hypothetical protein
MGQASPRASEPRKPERCAGSVSRGSSRRPKGSTPCSAQAVSDREPEWDGAPIGSPAPPDTRNGASDQLRNPVYLRLCGGRYWDRTSDLFGVKQIEHRMRWGDVRSLTCRKSASASVNVRDRPQRLSLSLSLSPVLTGQVHDGITSLRQPEPAACTAQHPRASHSDAAAPASIGLKCHTRSLRSTIDQGHSELRRAAVQGRNYSFHIEINGHRYDNSTLTSLTSGRVEYWQIDIPSVLWILERIAAGDIDARVARKYLLDATTRESGCCESCDRAMSHYDEAREIYHSIAREWTESHERLDPDDFPYILNKGKIHTLTCRHPPKASLRPFPEDLHTFGIMFEYHNENLEAFFEDLIQQSSRNPRRVGLDYVREIMIWRGTAAAQAKMCGSCKPPLPDLDPSSATLQPACWSWEADETFLKQLRIQAAQHPQSTSSVLPEHAEAFRMLELWHNGRCGVCGQGPSNGTLVRDHDHKTGWIRGLLCDRCNRLEGTSTSLLFENYRQQPPSQILDIKVLYLPSTFRSAAIIETIDE